MICKVNFPWSASTHIISFKPHGTPCLIWEYHPHFTREVLEIIALIRVALVGNRPQVHSLNLGLLIPSPTFSFVLYQAWLLWWVFCTCECPQQKPGGMKFASSSYAGLLDLWQGVEWLRWQHWLAAIACGSFHWIALKLLPFVECCSFCSHLSHVSSPHWATRFGLVLWW